MSKLSARSDSNAMWVPSGDQLGQSSWARGLVTSCTLPSAFMSQISCWLSRRSLTNAIRPGIGTGAGAAALSRHPPRVPHTIAIEHVVGNRAFTLRLLWRGLIKLRAEGATFHPGALAPDDAVRPIDKCHPASLPREEVHGAPESKHPVRDRARGDRRAVRGAPGSPSDPGG